MSLFRRNTLYVGLEPDRASVVCLAGLRKPRVLADTSIPFALDPRAPLLGPLIEALADPAFKASEIHLTLADTLVRYFVTEAKLGVRSRAELEETIAAHFEEQFGLPAGDWMISADLEPGADAYLACAVPRALVEALRGACAGARLRVAGMTPYAVSEMNRWHRRLPGRDFWFAAAAPRSLTLGYRARTGWRGMRTHAGAADVDTQLAALAQRDALLHGVAEVAPVRCSGLVGQPVHGTPSATLLRLGAGLWPGRGEAWSRSYRLALSGAWP